MLSFAAACFDASDMHSADTRRAENKILDTIYFISPGSMDSVEHEGRCFMEICLRKGIRSDCLQKICQNDSFGNHELIGSGTGREGILEG